jgi:hypothetical protein
MTVAYFKIFKSQKEGTKLAPGVAHMCQCAVGDNMRKYAKYISNIIIAALTKRLKKHNLEELNFLFGKIKGFAT